MSKTEKIVIANDSNKPLLIMLEPWGEDYTLVENEEIEIIAEDCAEDFHYHIAHEIDYVAVYAEGGNRNEYPRVYCKGVELDCGYNRNLSGKL